ncbi:MAG TPA: NUDIX hydrolase [Myxococcota bacterium]|nr:NUDIX hydrolase [Myxococcota bacterium]
MKSRVVYRGRSIVVCVDEVTLPNGHRVELDVVRHPGAAAVVPFVSPREVLLLRQFRHAAGGVIWEVPAGKLDGDAPEVCARKELEEEAGRRAGRLEKLGSILTTPGFSDEVIHLFAAFDLEEVPHRREIDEVMEVVCVPLARALDMVERGELRDAKSALALLHAARRVGVLARLPG